MVIDFCFNYAIKQQCLKYNQGGTDMVVLKLFIAVTLLVL